MWRTLSILLSPVLAIGLLVPHDTPVSASPANAAAGSAITEQPAPPIDRPVFDEGTEEPDVNGDIRFGSSEPVQPKPRSLDVEYVVEIDDVEVGSQLVTELVDDGLVVTNSWVGAVTGFSAFLDQATVDQLRTTRGVVSVAENLELSADVVQTAAPWNLDRLDQRDLPLDTMFSYERTGQGVRAYVLDSGIRETHSEFGGRVDPGYYWDFGDGTGSGDCNGHGTHVAGVLGGATYGVAKDVRFVPIKVLGCSGSTSVEIFVVGVNQIIDHYRNDPMPSVVNMSVGGPQNSAVDSAVQALVDEGLTVVAAAGNDAVPSCSQSPARSPEAITVAASTETDVRASFSNYGSCNDLFAPGTQIVSASSASDTSAVVKSGTSMATAHVSGAAAMVLEQTPSVTPEMMWATIRDQSSPGRVAGGLEDPDLLLFIEPPAPPEALERFPGANRIETAILLSQHGYPDGSASTVVLARSDLFPDALAGGPLAAETNGPVLLTSSQTLDQAVRAEIDRVLAPDGRIYLLGGDGSISEGIEQQLANDGDTVERLAGPDRYATAIAIADEIETVSGVPATEIFIAGGRDFPDALSASAAAGNANRNGSQTAVILLSREQATSPVVASYVDSHADASKVAVGGPAVSTVVCGDARVTCLSGADRYQTAARVAETYFDGAAGIGVATGENFPDSLALAPLLAQRGWPLIIVPGDGPVPSRPDGSIREYLERNSVTITGGLVAGGTGVLSRAVSDAISDLVQIPPE